MAPALSAGNLDKTIAAPVTVIVAYDPKFYEHLPRLFPHNPDARSWFTSNEALAAATAFRNGTLQGAYLILAAQTGRALLSAHRLAVVRDRSTAPLSG